MKSDKELLEKARNLYNRLGGINNSDARLVRALIERSSLKSEVQTTELNCEQVLIMDLKVGDVVIGENNQPLTVTDIRPDKEGWVLVDCGVLSETSYSKWAIVRRTINET